MNNLENFRDATQHMGPGARLLQLKQDVEDVSNTSLQLPPGLDGHGCYTLVAAIANRLGVTSKDLATAILPEWDGLCVHWPAADERYQGIDEEQAWEEFTDLVERGRMERAAVLYQTYPQAMMEREEGIMTVPMRGLYWTLDTGRVDNVYEFMKYFHTMMEYDNDAYNRMLYERAREADEERGDTLMTEVLRFAGFSEPVLEAQLM